MKTNIRYLMRYMLLLLLCTNAILFTSKPILSLQKPKTTDFILTDSFLRRLALLSKAQNFVETGTYYGASTKVASSIFENVYSVELSPSIHAEALKILSSYKNIHLYLGDSKEVLPLIIKELKGKTIFFLDGHYSGPATAKGDYETPIIDELLAIKNSNIKQPIIIIDDIRFFTRHLQSDYPSLLEIEKLIKQMDNQYNLYVAGDMAIAFHNDEPFTVSPLIQACTTSRMIDEYTNPPQELESVIYDAEKIIARAEGLEKEALLDLLTTYEQHDIPKIGYHYRLWAGLIELNGQHYAKARKHFLYARDLGSQSERIKYYLDQARKKY